MWAIGPNVDCLMPGVKSGRPFYGWWIVGALAVTEPVSWGVQYYALTVFLRPMEEELGWSRSQLTGAFSLALLVSGLAAIPFGRWLDRHGPRALMTAGSIAATLLVLAWSRVESLPVFYLVWVGLGLTMAATFYEPAFVGVAHWFTRLRGRALTLLTLGGALASPIFIPLADRLVGRYGWREALVILAVVLGRGHDPSPRAGAAAAPGRSRPVARRRTGRRRRFGPSFRLSVLRLSVLRPRSHPAPGDPGRRLLVALARLLPGDAGHGGDGRPPHPLPGRTRVRPRFRGGRDRRAGGDVVRRPGGLRTAGGAVAAATGDGADLRLAGRGAGRAHPRRGRGGRLALRRRSSGWAGR